MKKLLLLVFTFSFISTNLLAQKAKPKAKISATKKTTKDKKVKKDFVESAYDNLNGLSLYVKEEDGNMTIRDLQKGDKLVYEINANGQVYDFSVTPKLFNYENGFEFDYEMSNSNKTMGHVIVTANGRNEGRKYVNYFGGGEMVLTDASTIMLTGLNFREMPDKKTQINLDDSPEETFYRPEKDEVDIEVLYKGKKVKLDAFKINNAKDDSGNKTIWIQNGSACPLIVYMNLGWTVKLKEVR